MKKKFLNFFLFIVWANCISLEAAETFNQKLKEPVPQWMKQQIEEDLSALRNQPIKRSQISDYYCASSPEHYLVQFTIRNNEITTECKTSNSEGIEYRKRAYEDALKAISRYVRLPDTVFLISMHDAYTLSNGVPVFSMCKRESDYWAILVPDFDALREKFQVLPTKDLTVYEPRWEDKKDLLIWRGSTAQASLDGELMRPDNIHRFSRVILCELSQKYPELIDAKFTFFAQGGENIPYLKRFQARQMPFEELIQYKHHLFIDGNVSPYSASGWKFFINSLIFKPDSPWIQWYFNALRPYEHYIPLQKDLSDLVEKFLWVKNHSEEASRIVRQTREFAVKNLILSNHWLYFYYLLEEYSRFVSLD